MNQVSLRGCLVALLLFGSLVGIMYYLQSGSPDCIRTIDGAVRCECEFSSSDEYSKYKKETHGAWRRFH